MPCPTLRPSAPSREGSDRRTRERMPRMRCGKPPFQRQQFPAPPSRSDVAPNPRPRRRARPEVRKCSARDVPRPAYPDAARVPKRADAAKPLVFGHGTAFWRENRRRVRDDPSATWGLSGKSLHKRRNRRENAPRVCQNAVPWPKIAPPPAWSNAKAADGNASGNRGLRKRGKGAREAAPNTIASRQKNAPATPHPNKSAHPRHHDARTR